MAATHDIRIDQGANFLMTIEYRNPDNTPIAMTGYTFLFQIKTAPGGALIANWNSYVTISNVPGRVIVNVPYTATENLNFDQGSYDLLAISPSAGRTRILQGRASLSRRVST